MKHVQVWLGGLAVAVLVWIGAAELHWAARLFTALLLGPAPVLFMLQAHATAALPGPLPRKPIYAGTIAGLWILAGITIAVAVVSGFTARVMGLHAINNAILVLWSLCVVLGASAIVAVFKAFGFADAQVMHDIVPVTRGEKLLFALLAISAGICEELTFRSFLLPALMVATGSLAAAVVLSSAAFGLLHAHQRAAGAARAGLLGALLCVPFIMTGSILPSMIGHIAVDLAGGIWLARWVLK